MTQIVIISHSKAIAAGTKDLLKQMAPGVTVIDQGGVGDDIGTSYDHIQALINQVDDDTLCFYDIGSAEMNLDLAIAMYEGSFTAAVKLSVGGSIDETIEALNKTFG